jgi:two-component system OmpR family response regulator
MVCDDSSVAERFSRLLRLEGHQVWSAGSTDAGLVLARTHRPDAIILDLRMPLSGTLRVLQSIGEAAEGAVAAIVTGDYTAAGIGGLMEPNARLRYKPFWLHELVELARELVEVPARA